MACKYVKEFEFGSASKAKGKPYAEGGNVKADLKQDKKMVTAAVHKHEKAQHPGKPLTKMAMGGLTRDQVFAGLQQNKQAAQAASQRNMRPQAAQAQRSLENMNQEAQRAQRNMNQQQLGQLLGRSSAPQGGMPAQGMMPHQVGRLGGVPQQPMKKGGKVLEKSTGERYPSRAAMVKHEKLETPRMEREEMVQKRVVKGPAMSAGRDPRTPLIAMKCGGMYKKGK